MFIYTGKKKAGTALETEPPCMEGRFLARASVRELRLWAAVGRVEGRAPPHAPGKAESSPPKDLQDRKASWPQNNTRGTECAWNRTGVSGLFARLCRKSKPNCFNL